MGPSVKENRRLTCAAIRGKLYCPGGGDPVRHIAPAQAELANTNSDSGLLKLVAIVTMIVDHVGAVFFPQLTWMRIIGRIAFPLFAWGIVIGAVRSRNWPRYALRLGVAALVTQPVYMLALGHQLYEGNVLFTLLLGLAAIVGIREKWHGSHVWAPALCITTAIFVQMDYGWKGVLFILLLYGARNSRGALAGVMVAFCLYWGSTSMVLDNYLGLPAATAGGLFWTRLQGFLGQFLRLQALALLALPLMLCPTRSGLKLPKWFGYAAYPGHLLLIWLARRALGI